MLELGTCSVGLVGKSAGWGGGGKAWDYLLWWVLRDGGRYKLVANPPLLGPKMGVQLKEGFGHCDCIGYSIYTALQHCYSKI